MTARAEARRQQHLTAGGFCLLAAVLIWIPLRPAHAYVDPNSVGPLYQFLFPLFIAIASAFAALRRQLARLWNRVVSTVVAAVRGERSPPGNR